MSETINNLESNGVILLLPLTGKSLRCHRYSHCWKCARFVLMDEPLDTKLQTLQSLCPSKYYGMSSEVEYGPSFENKKDSMGYATSVHVGFRVQGFGVRTRFGSFRSLMLQAV